MLWIYLNLITVLVPAYFFPFSKYLASNLNDLQDVILFIRDLIVTLRLPHLQILQFPIIPNWVIK